MPAVNTTPFLGTAPPAGTFDQGIRQLTAFEQFPNAVKLYTGAGVPTTPSGQSPAVGDLYVRTDTPTIANQRLYMCSNAVGPVWTALV